MNRPYFLPTLLLIAQLVAGSSTFGQAHLKEDFSWQSGDVKLQGTLYLPDTDGPHPCAVLIHGSGTLSRFGRSGSMFREHAERLSKKGLAVLIYDKRGAGRSTGDWKKATLNDLGDDALVAVNQLRARKDIDPAKIGLIGSSQGGWITLMVAQQDPKIAYIVTVSGPTITPAEQGHYTTEAALRKKGYNDEDVEAALKLDRQIAEVYRTDSGWEEARQSIEAAKAQKWFADAGIGIQAPDSWNWKWYRDLPFDLDPIPLLNELQIPLLAVHGENDMLVPARRSAETITKFNEQGKNFQAVVFPDVGHGINAGKGRTWEAPGEYWLELEKWLRETRILRGQEAQDESVVAQLDKLIRENHVRPFWVQNQHKYEAVVSEAKSRLANENLTDEQRNVELLKVLAAVRDGHTGMAASSRDQLFGYIPITTEWFGDELRVVRTSSDYKETLGAKILSAEETELAELSKLLMTVVPHANPQRFKKTSPSYLQLPGLLYGMGVAGSPDQTRFTVQLKNGETNEIIFQRMNDEQYKNATFVTTDQIAESLPLYRQRSDENYWYEYLPDEKIFYLKYNRTTSDDAKPIWIWAPAMWSEVDSLEIDKFVIDIRDNGGGGFQYSLPILQGILDRPKLNKRGKLFALTGYKTFSAAIGFLEQLETRSNAIIVGIPPCDHPASPGDADGFSLGESGIKINLSQIFHATLFPDDRRTAIGLDQVVNTSWDDYADGADPLLNFVKNFRMAKQTPSLAAAFDWVGRYSFSIDKVLTLTKVESELRLEIGKFFATPLYSIGNGRFSTEIVGLEIGLNKPNQIKLGFPDGTQRTLQRCATNEPTPVELIYEGKFDEAQAAYTEILKSDPNGNLVSDAQLSETALLLYWDLVKEKGRTAAKKYARKTLELAIELFDEAPLSEYSLRFYR